MSPEELLRMKDVFVRLFFGAMLASFVGSAPAATGSGITFPADAGVLDAREFGAKPDDTVDDTAAIQKALDAFPNGNRIVFLPPGTWRVSDTLRWPKGEGGNGEKRTILQGAGMLVTRLLLPEATLGFAAGAEKPKALIWTGERPAQRFRNAVRDLTIEIAKGNPEAIALQFNASNQGTIRNLILRAAPDSGKIGLDLGFTDEIGPLLVRRLLVEGFETGIVTKWPVNSNTFEQVILRGQRKLGWHNYHQMIFVRGLISENGVTALYNEKDSNGTITLIDSKITGQSPGETVPGVLNQRHMYLRNVEVKGYPIAIDHADKGRDKGDVVASGTIAEDTSHTQVHGLFREISGQTFASVGPVAHLPVKESPEVPWGDPARDWVNIERFGADPEGKTDASTALQRAIDSGAANIYLPAGKEFFFDGEVLIRGPVRRIIGLEGRFFTTGKAVWRLVDAPGRNDSPGVIIERMTNRSGDKAIVLRHESKRTLIVSSVTGLAVEGHGSGDIFVDDLCGQLNLNHPGQSAWCRQLNVEHEGTMCRNNGGKLWILGMKTEKIGTIIETVNGGITDAAGIFVYSNAGWRDGLPAFLIENSTAILCGINERNFNRQPVSLWIREIQGGETREMKELPWVYLSK
jgi:hypothetical protein